MERFDQPVNTIMARIAAARSTKQDEANSLAMTADSMFGNVRMMIEELRPRLAEKLPELKPEISMSGWTQKPTKDGAISTLKLETATATKEIPLEITFGRADVSIDGKM